MKFARFPKFSVLSLLAGVFALALAGCGGTSNMALTQGNWAVAASSSQSANTFSIGGNLTQSGSKVSGTMYITGSNCFDSSQPVAITGTVKGNHVTLTSAAVAGQVITVTATATSGSVLAGTYTAAGGCSDGDKGSASANAVPSISGTWSGTVQVNSSPATMSIALTQAAPASSDGTFALSGTVTYTGSVCSSTASLTSPATIFGGNLTINAAMDTGSFNYTAALDSVTAPTSIAGTYSVSDSCATDADQTVMLTKQ